MNGYVNETVRDLDKTHFRSEGRVVISVDIKI